MQVRHDEADARQQLAGMPLRLRHDLTRGAPTLRTVADARVEAPHVMRWPTHRAREQVSSRLWSTWLAGRRIAYWEVIRLQVLVHLGQREGRIAAQQAPEAPAAIPSHHRVEHFAPAVRTVHAARCTAVSVRMAFVARTAGAAAQGTVTASMAAANVAATGIKTFVSAYRKFAPARGPSRLDPQARRDAHEAMGRRSERVTGAAGAGPLRRAASAVAPEARTGRGSARCPAARSRRCAAAARPGGG